MAGSRHMPPRTGARAAAPIQSVERALLILRELGEGPSTVSHLADRLELTRPTVSRLLKTLAAYRMATKAEGTQAYRLGAEIARLGSQYLGSFSLTEQLRELVTHLHRETGETVLVTAWDNSEPVYVLKLESHHALRTSSRIGSIAPWHRGASGKVLLAFLEAKRQTEILQSLQGTLAEDEVQSLRADLAFAKKYRYVVCRGEIDQGHISVAAPVWDLGRLAGAVAVTAPTVRFSEDRINEVTTLLCKILQDAAKPGTQR